MQVLSDIAGLCRAILIAARYELRFGGILSACGSALQLLNAVCSLVFQRGERASKKLVEQRLAACFKCPIYCSELGTCGDFREMIADPIGCGCHVKTKAKFKDSECWLHEPEQGGIIAGAGWPKEALK